MKLETIRENHIFRRLYYRGKNEVCPEFVVYRLSNRKKGKRIGLTVSNKLGNAPTRSRIRRIFRAALVAQYEILPQNTDLVFVARSRCKNLKSTDIERALGKVFGEKQ